MTGEELKLWHEYSQIKTEQENYRLGLVLSAIYNQARSSEKDKVFTPEDFFTFDYLKTEEEQSVETQMFYLQVFAQGINAKLQK